MILKLYRPMAKSEETKDTRGFVKLFDAHAHSKLSYCANETLDLDVYKKALDAPGTLLGRQGITNHGFQAYFPSDIAWSWIFLDQYDLFDQYKNRGDDLLLACKAEIEAFDDRLVFGIEVEMMGDGRLTVTPEVQKESGLILGSLHVLPAAYEGDGSPDALLSGFVRYTRDIAASGIHVLAHPFRWMAANLGHVPHEILQEVLAIARDNDLAVELNIRGHSISRVLLVQAVQRAGLKLSLGSDAHAAREVGKLDEHVAFIRDAGYRLEDINFFEGPPA